MEFCPDCGTRLVPTKTENGVTLGCAKCGYLKSSKAKIEAKGTTKTIKHDLQQQVITIGKDDEVNIMPKMRMECPKCGHMEVFVWQVQTRGGDEPYTQFFPCTKCGHTFREYS
jgi:DNA-directed RNA polymerase subunit M